MKHSIYTDNFHQINIVTNDNDRKSVVRSTREDSCCELEREYFVQKDVSKLGICPVVSDFQQESFKEEFIVGSSFGEARNIKSIAKSLKLLHSLELNKLSSRTSDLVIRDSSDTILVVYEKLVSVLPSDLLEKDIVVYLRSQFIEIDTYLKLSSLSKRIIHGDLSPSNIIVKGNGDATLIDWGDTRIDYPSFDVTQLFYLNRFDPEEVKVFSDEYGPLNHKLLRMNFLLLLIYDMGYSFVNGNLDESLKLKIKLIQAINNEESNLFFTSS